MGPAVSFAGFLTALVFTGWFFLYRPTGQIVDQLALLGARSYAESSGGRLRTALYELVRDVTGAAVGVAGPWFIAAVIVISTLR